MRAQLIRGSKTYVNLQPSSYIFAGACDDFSLRLQVEPFLADINCTLLPSYT
jgi:hypothetical protein